MWIYAELRALLDMIPKRATTVLTNSRGLPWKGFGASFQKARDKALGPRPAFHDLHGTVATRLYPAGLQMRSIAEILACDEVQVERVIRRYVGRNAAVLDVIRQLALVDKG